MRTGGAAAPAARAQHGHGERQAEDRAEHGGDRRQLQAAQVGPAVGALGDAAIESVDQVSSKVTGSVARNASTASTPMGSSRKTAT